MEQRDRFVPLATDDLRGVIVDRHTLEEYHPKAGKDYLRIRLPGIGRMNMHVVVAIWKYGEQYVYNDGILARHLDGNPLNNSPDNISVGTYRDNALDVPEEDRKAAMQRGVVTYIERNGWEAYIERQRYASRHPRNRGRV